MIGGGGGAPRRGARSYARPEGRLMRALVVSHTLVDPLSSRLRDILRERVDPQGPAIVRFEDIEQRLAQASADLLVLVLSPDAERGLDGLRKVRRHTSAYVLAVGQASEPKLILRALHDGADLFLDETDLEEGLESALNRLQSKGEAGAPQGRMIGVLASSGGSGASTLAVNVATVLAKDHERCALLDLKPGRGDLAALLDLKPAFTLADLCLNVARLDWAMFEKVLAQHHSGVHLLASPQLFGGLRVVTAQGVGQALGLARKLFPYVVVDLEDCFHEEQVLAVRQAAVLLLVVRLDFTSLRNARRILEHLRELEVPEGRIRLVANRFGQPNELPVSEAESALGVKLAHYVPEDARTINAANNTGIPAVLKAPTTKVSQALTQLARLVVERRRSNEAPAGVRLMVR
jgi:pilus assembly protein CpaE